MEKLNLIKKIIDDWAAALLQKSLKGGKSIKIPSLDIEIAPPDEGERSNDDD